MPKMEVKSNARPSLYGYVPHLEKEKGKEREKVRINQTLFQNVHYHLLPQGCYGRALSSCQEIQGQTEEGLSIWWRGGQHDKGQSPRKHGSGQCTSSYANK